MATHPKLVFIAGLRGTGATQLTRELGKLPDISCFQNTRAPENNGDYLQDVLPSAKNFEAPDMFAFHAEARTPVESPLATPATADLLISQWSAYWDLSKPVRVEKSAIDLLRTRFLQKLFPDSYFIVTKRSPIETGLFSSRFTNPGFDRIVEHWITAYELFEQDRPFLTQLHEVRFEEWLDSPETVLEAIKKFIGLGDGPPHQGLRSGTQFHLWDALAKSKVQTTKAHATVLSEKFGERVSRLGYSISLESHRDETESTSAERSGASRSGPDFLVIGAQKAGTSSFFAYLSDHPDILPPFKKELHFFDLPSDYRMGLDWYESMFPRRDQSETPLMLTGESTPYYLSEPRTPERVARHYPHVRLITILRNPVDRAYSHYQMNFRRRVESLSFEAAVEKEEERLYGESEKIAEDESYIALNFRRYSYLRRGLYLESLLRWKTFFPTNQMLVLNNDDLRNKHVETMNRAYEFVGARPWESTNTDLYNSYAYPKLGPEIRQKLSDYFAPYNELLYAFLGVDFGWS